ncbi:adhesion G protein-coupled receptor E1-like isoform X2 [Saccostrea cucullata]|uniref:adhesion G protein-coupled receptor E1-like isoform X2 n=1 Tax=Saccostrea cuccullata TaxID=36930 RepID=UPI002ED3900D
MENVLPILIIFLYVLTTRACKGIQEIILQPYIGEKVAYPENYPVEKGYGNNLNCSWKISTITGYDIVVYPRWACKEDADFRLYYGSTTLTEIDGCVGCPKAYGYCGEIIQTGSSGILLNFRTSAPFKGGGFQFRFMSVEKRKNDKCESTEQLIAESTPKFITSPGFPSAYPSQVQCSWIVVSDLKENFRLIFEFRSQYLEEGFIGCNDYVKIDSVGEFCEYKEDTILRTSDRMILNDTITKVQFVSDHWFSGSGFVLAFYVEVLPRLLLQMEPRYDVSIQSGQIISLQCTIMNPEALIYTAGGDLIWQKDGKNIETDSDFYITTTNLSTTLMKNSVGIDDSGNYLCSHSDYPDTENDSINVIVTKPSHTKQIECQREMFSNITWKAIIAGTTAQESCPEKQIGTATRYCNTRGVWEMPNLINCTSEAFVDASKEAFFEVVDNVLSISNTNSWATVQEKTEKGATWLIKNMDRLSIVLLKSDNITATKFNGTNFELAIDQTTIDEEGILFPDISSSNSNKSVDEYATFLDLPKQENKSKTTITYVAVIYRTLSEILRTDSDLKRKKKKVTDNTRKKEEDILNSEILSLTTQIDFVFLFPPLSLTFQHKNKNYKYQAICVSWNFTSNKWSERGCRLNSTNKKRTVCQCNHLTNFAILMRPYTSEKEDKDSLKTLSLIGVILSVAFTVLTFLIYIMTWKHIKNDQNIMLLNLCGSLVLSYVLFISAVEETKNEVLCIAITAVIHYLFLVTFFCMMGMGVYYFMSITVTYYALHVANNFKSKSRVHWFLLGGWDKYTNYCILNSSVVFNVYND